MKTSKQPYLAINYGIFASGGGGKFLRRCGKLRIKGDWSDDETHQRIRRRVLEKHPGWVITGYCIAP